MKFNLKIIIYLLSLFASLNLAYAEEEKADATIKALYHSINNKPVTMPTRLEMVSASFLGKPYLLGALGEGKQAQFDQSPLYRTDAFDCETLVTTTLAIALAANEEHFHRCLLKLRYSNGKPEFIFRNHFTGLDWNLNNQRQGFLKDITTTITNSDKEPVFQTAVAFIDKPAWYQHFTTQNIKLAKPNLHEQTKRLAELKKLGNTLPRQTEMVPYLPLAVLFDKQGNANQQLFNQIPNGAIIEIIRPNWDLRSKIGTNLNISHLGFVFIRNKQLIFRQASSELHRVVDVSLIEYLRKTLTSPTIKGINVQIVVPQKPLVNC